MGVEYLAVMATIIAALVGAISGYLGAYFQTKELRRAKKDEIAQALTELEIERLQQLGIPSKYNSIAHYVVLRELLEKYGNNKGDVPIESLRDEYQLAYLSACSTQAIENLFSAPDGGNLTAPDLPLPESNTSSSSS